MDERADVIAKASDGAAAQRVGVAQREDATVLLGARTRATGRGAGVAAGGRQPCHPAPAGARRRGSGDTPAPRATTFGAEIAKLIGSVPDELVAVAAVPPAVVPRREGGPRLRVRRTPMRPGSSAPTATAQ
jgi:hypothetical protein